MKKKKDEFPDYVYISNSGQGKPFYSIHQGDFANLSRDTTVGVYKFVRLGEVKVTRKLHKKKKKG